MKNRPAENYEVQLWQTVKTTIVLGCGKASVSILNQSLHNYVLHHEISRASFFGAGIL